MDTARTRPLVLDALPPGTVVGHWRVVEQLGVGGYGAVYRVEDVNHPLVFLALKLALRPGDARAEREVVLLMEKAVHPHVVRFHGCGRWPDPVKGHTYHVMDLVPGLPMDVWTETRNPSFLRFAEVGAKMTLTLRSPRAAHPPARLAQAGGATSPASRETRCGRREPRTAREERAGRGPRRRRGAETERSPALGGSGRGAGPRSRRGGGAGARPGVALRRPGSGQRG